MNDEEIKIELDNLYEQLHQEILERDKRIEKLEIESEKEHAFVTTFGKEVRKELAELKKYVYENHYKTHEIETKALQDNINELKEQIKNIWQYLPSDLGEQINELKEQIEHIKGTTNTNIQTITPRLFKVEEVLRDEFCKLLRMLAIKEKDTLGDYHTELVLMENRIDKKLSSGEKEVGDIERWNHSRKKPDHKGLPNSKPPEKKGCYQFVYCGECWFDDPRDCPVKRKNIEHTVIATEDME